MLSAAPAEILIVDDHPMVRAGLTMRISTQHDLRVCGEAATEDEALSFVQAHQPELIIVDITLKNGNGISMIKQVKSRFPTIKMLVVSGYPEALYAERALRAGAMGYVNKQESNDKILVAIRAVLNGQHFVGQEIMQRLVGDALGNAKIIRTPIERLSNRELEIFRLIGEGNSSSAIARQLFLSSHTIDTHRENIKRKISAKNATELTRAAVEWVVENREPS